MKSNEETINQIRNHLIEAVEELEEFGRKSEIRSPRLKRAAVLMECIAVEFERLVDQIPVEARS